jgi:hypothetical protein
MAGAFWRALRLTLRGVAVYGLVAGVACWVQAVWWFPVAAQDEYDDAPALVVMCLALGVGAIAFGCWLWRASTHVWSPPVAVRLEGAEDESPCGSRSGWR